MLDVKWVKKEKCELKKETQQEVWGSARGQEGEDTDSESRYCMDDVRRGT